MSIYATQRSIKIFGSHSSINHKFEYYSNYLNVPVFSSKCGYMVYFIPSHGQPLIFLALLATSVKSTQQVCFIKYANHGDLWNKPCYQAKTKNIPSP